MISARVSGWPYTEINVNGFETGYGHQTRFAEGIKAGVRVAGATRDYIGSTAARRATLRDQGQRSLRRSLSVKLPRDKSLSAQYDGAFKQTIAQVRDLMQRDAKP